MVKAKAGMRMDAEGFALIQSVGDRGKPAPIELFYCPAEAKKRSEESYFSRSLSAGLLKKF